MESMVSIINEINSCSLCWLCNIRNNTVPGIGNLDATTMFIGEAPGEEEDLQGKPFVGKSGKLLRGALVKVGISAEDIYITNILKCRPPKNRSPQLNEVACCRKFLTTQINIIQPKFIVLVGSVALSVFFGKNSSMTDYRGKLYKKYGVNFYTIFHPSYILRSPSSINIFLEDLSRFKDLMYSQEA